MAQQTVTVTAATPTVAVDGVSASTTEFVTGTAPLSLPFFDVSAHPYNATGDGVTDDSTAIQAAMTAAGSSGTVLFPPGTYNIGTTGLTTTGSVWMLPGASISYSGTGTALLVNNTDRCEFIVDIRRSSVTWHTGVDTTSVGLRLLNTDYARVRATCQNFNIGIDMRGEDSGTSYGVLDCINVTNNKIGLRFSKSGTGWANQWEVRGQIRIDSTYTGIAGSRYIDMSTAGNNITFINMTLEANTPEVTAYIASPYNAFINCRFEQSTGITYDGTSCEGNLILGGYANQGPAGGAGTLAVTLVNSADPPLILSTGGSSFGIDGTSAYLDTASTTIGRFVGTWRFTSAPQCNASGTSPAIHLGVNSGDPKVFRGTGSPESVVTAGIGSIFLRSDGGAGTMLYLKESGANTTTGWRPVPSATTSTGWTTFTNLSSDKTCDANATTVEELADILGTLIEALKTVGIVAA